MAAVAILLLGWALLASQDAAEAQVETTSTPPAGDGIDGPTGQVPPQRPTGLTGQGGSRQISLDWNTVAGATGYEVQQWDGRANSNGNGSWRTLPFTETGVGSYTVAFSGSSAVVSGLRDRLGYFHRVRTVQGSESSSWTAFVLTYTLAATTATQTSTSTATHTPTPSLNATATAAAKSTATATVTPTATSAPTAELDPDPSDPDEVDWEPDGEWHEFDLDSSEDEVRIVANKGGGDRILELATTDSEPDSDWCPPSRNEEGTVEDGDEFYVAACDEGIAKIQIWNSNKTVLLREYTIGVSRVVPTPTRTPTVTPTPTGPANTPTPTHTSVSCPSGDSGGASGASADTCTPPDDSVCIQQLGSQSQEFNVSHSNQSWRSSCPSARSSSILKPQYYAQYYTFTINKSSYVTIDLITKGSSPNSQLYLRAGRDETGIVPIASDAGSYPDGASGQGDDSRIVKKLPKGAYTIEATTVEQSTTGNFTLKVYGEEPLAFLGHQADHTVRYAIGTMLPTRTAVPAGSPTPAVPDPAVVIPTSVPRAAIAWNKAVATPWPNVLFCKSGSSCSARNTDGRVVPINVVHIGRNRVSISGDCGDSTACVKPSGSWADGSGHLKNMTIVIEEPGWRFNTDKRTYSRKIWTNNFMRHGRITPMGDRYIYLPVIMAHEFGHTAGLGDLYGFGTMTPTPVNAEAYLMNNLEVGLPQNTRTPVTIPTADVKFMKQVYRNEGGSERH